MSKTNTDYNNAVAVLNDVGDRMGFDRRIDDTHGIPGTWRTIWDGLLPSGTPVHVTSTFDVRDHTHSVNVTDDSHDQIAGINDPSITELTQFLIENFHRIDTI